MIFDPLYLLVMLIGGALSGWAAIKTRGNFNKYSKFTTQKGWTGREIAEKILADHGIRDVTVEPVAGHLTDHYDPRTKTLRLSEPTYGGRSISAFGVAAHEVGHAVQHREGYAMLKLRSAWVPLAGLGTNVGFILLFIALILQGTATVAGTVVGWVGVGLFSCSTIFTLITLPVEFDASKRALFALERGGYVTGEELQGAKKVLDAAALTYVAAFIGSLLMLLYWAFRLGLLGGRNE